MRMRKPIQTMPSAAVTGPRFATALSPLAPEVLRTLAVFPAKKILGNSRPGEVIFGFPFEMLQPVCPGGLPGGGPLPPRWPAEYWKLSEKIRSPCTVVKARATPTAAPMAAKPENRKDATVETFVFMGNRVIGVIFGFRNGRCLMRVA